MGKARDNTLVPLIRQVARGIHPELNNNNNNNDHHEDLGDLVNSRAPMEGPNIVNPPSHTPNNRASSNNRSRSS